MSNAAAVGEYVYSRLSTVEGLTSAYPIVAENGAAYPFAVYQTRTSVQWMKDGYREISADVTIRIIGDVYANVVELAGITESAMTHKSDGVMSRLIGTSEEYAGAYIITQNYNVIIYE